MPNALLGVTSLPRGQSKKTDDTSGTSGTPPTEPATTTTTTTTTTTESTASGPMPASGTSEPAGTMQTYRPAAAANDVGPMPDRLRDLIVEYSRQAAPKSTSLHALVTRLAAVASAPENVLGPEQLQRTRTEIMTAASMSMVAQANHTGDSVRALLGAAA